MRRTHLCKIVLYEWFCLTQPSVNEAFSASPTNDSCRNYVLMPVRAVPMQVLGMGHS